jgi:predicted RNA methylase
VIGFDIDPESLETATLNAEELEVEIDFVQCDITKLELKGTILLSFQFIQRKEDSTGNIFVAP